MLQSAQTAKSTQQTLSCYHCGLPCKDEEIQVAEKTFCCHGCRMVFEILNENNLCEYYALNATPGERPSELEMPERFAYLDDTVIQRQLLDYSDDHIARITFYIPAIRCSSCLWLLENLYKLQPAITDSRVNFLEKKLALTYHPDQISLRKVVELLASLGYTPLINLDSAGKAAVQRTHRSLYIKIGVAGFCFGNIMLLSFPEYLAIGDTLSPLFRRFFGIMNLMLALPVLLYSASDYLRSAFTSLRHRTINIDVPLSLGILTMFGRSLYEILLQNGGGYMDSFAGLVFFLLIGKLFQEKTYDNLSFERDYKSFFPIAVTRKSGVLETSIPLARLAVGDRIIVRHQELVPADSVLISDNGLIDYSFVTGESQPVARHGGELIYAGGRQAGSAIELEVVKEVSQSYLTQLWNNDAFSDARTSGMNSFVNVVSKYFTLAVLVVATAAALFWLRSDTLLALNAFTAVLIIACPCALALSTPFTLGNVLRLFGRQGFYLKNTQVIENLSNISTIVFDKTGTLTLPRSAAVAYTSLNGRADLSANHQLLVKSTVAQSMHPLSVNIFNTLSGPADAAVQEFREIPGEGITAMVDNVPLKVGSAQFTGGKASQQVDAAAVFVAINEEVKGYFTISNAYRQGLGTLIDRLSRRYRLALVSGDNDQERARLKHIFGKRCSLRFNQSPQEKLAAIREIRQQGERVLMIGDGLNDAGALRQSNVGVSVSEDLNSFSPACDAILDADRFTRLDDFIKFAGVGMNIIRFNLGLSLLYNVVGLSFAVTATLSPLVCAVLMPISSISVIAISSGVTRVLAGNYFEKQSSAISPQSTH